MPVHHMYNIYGLSHVFSKNRPKKKQEKKTKPNKAAQYAVIMKTVCARAQGVRANNKETLKITKPNIKRLCETTAQRQRHKQINPFVCPVCFSKICWFAFLFVIVHLQLTKSYSAVLIYHLPNTKCTRTHTLRTTQKTHHINQRFKTLP